MKQVLIADDDATNRYLMRSILTSDGYQVREASDGAQALEQARRDRPDIIVSDVLMPQMDGFALCRACKSEPLIRDVPFVFYTATYTSPQDEELALRLGGARFIRKPIEPKDLVEIIGEVLLERDAGHLPPSDLPEEEEAGALRAYNDVLVHKLEKKVLDLEREVAERTRVEQQLRKLSVAVEQSPSIVCLTNSAGDIEYVNARFREVTGYTSDEVLGQSPRILKSGLMPPEGYAGLWRAINSGTEWRGEFHNRKKDGSLFVEAATIAPIRGADGRITHFVKLAEDITARKEVEAELREGAERLETAVRAANVGLWDWDLRSNRVYYSPEWKRQIGYEAHEISNDLAEWESRVHPEDLPRVREIIRDFIAGARPDHNFEFRFRHRDGSYRWILTQGSLHRDEQGEPARMLGSHVDITERKHEEEEHQALQGQFFQAQKIQAVGRLAGGVAHDFNNILAVILGLGGLAVPTLRPDDPLRADLMLMLDAAHRGAEITRQLLAFARKEVVSPVVLDPNRAVASLEKMVRRLIGEDIALAIVPGNELWPIKIDPTHFDQVVVNLVTNARDAIEDVGSITVETANTTIGEEEAGAHPGIAAGEYVVLTVTDSGRGMDAATRDQMFEPFFTTKAREEGTGLGLSTVQGIVARSSGHIEVHSEPEQGTTLTVYLPRCLEAPAESSPVERIGSVTGTETVLVVEDDPILLALVRRTLVSYHYEVLVARNPGEALLLVEGDHEPIQLLLTDVVMPLMNGRELYERLSARVPGIKVLYMSGYPSDVLEQRRILEDESNFIQKPFTPPALAGMVRRVLDA